MGGSKVTSDFASPLLCGGGLIAFCLGLAMSVVFTATAARPIEPWWCLCYQLLATGAPATACRQSFAECDKLRAGTVRGTSGIVRGSADIACTAVYGGHPGDTRGGRDAWGPSKKTGRSSATQAAS